MKQRYQGDYRPDDNRYGDRDRQWTGPSAQPSYEADRYAAPSGRYVQDVPGYYAQRAGNTFDRSPRYGRDDWTPEQQGAGYGEWNDGYRGSPMAGPRPSAYEDYGNERGYAGPDPGQYAGGSSYYGGGRGNFGQAQGNYGPGSQYVSDMNRSRGSYGGYGATSKELQGPGSGTFASGYGPGGSYQAASPSSYQGGYAAANPNRSYDQGGYGSVAGAWGDDQRYPSGHGSASQTTGYRGLGPKGYKRSDERLQEDICERLMQDDAIDASDISVRASNGVVTLEGTVDERRLKHRVEDVIEQCSGVTDIENRLTVRSRKSIAAKPEGDDAGKQAGKKH